MRTNVRSALSKNGLKSVDENLLGKMPPQDVEAERKVIGACIVDSSAFPIAEQTLREEHFYNEPHQLIFGAMKDIWINTKKIDPVMLKNQLEFKGELERVGGYYAISKMCDGVASGANIEQHAEIIVNKWMLRESINVCLSFANKASDPMTDPIAFMADLDKQVQRISHITGRRDSSVGSRMKATMDRTAQAHSQGFIGTSWGHESFDLALGGARPGALIIVAGRPGMGKTSLALWLANSIALKGPAVMFFSLEMEAPEIGIREQAMMSGVSYEKIGQGGLTDPEYERIQQVSHNRINALKLDVDDESGISLPRLRSKMYAFIADNPSCAVCFIDYLGLMETDSTNKNKNRENEVASLIKGIKRLAKELKITIVLLAQLNRSVEQHGAKKRPVLSALRETGEAEQSADIVIFPYRPEYYGIQEEDDGTSNINRTEIIIAKNRQGKTRSFFMKSDMSTNQYDYDEHKPLRKSTLNNEDPF